MLKLRLLNALEILVATKVKKIKPYFKLLLYFLQHYMSYVTLVTPDSANISHKDAVYLD